MAPNFRPLFFFLLPFARTFTLLTRPLTTNDVLGRRKLLSSKGVLFAKSKWDSLIDEDDELEFKVKRDRLPLWRIPALFQLPTNFLNEIFVLAILHAMYAIANYSN